MGGKESLTESILGEEFFDCLSRNGIQYTTLGACVYISIGSKMGLVELGGSSGMFKVKLVEKDTGHLIATAVLHSSEYTSLKINFNPDGSITWSQGATVSPTPDLFSMAEDIINYVTLWTSAIKHPLI